MRKENIMQKLYKHIENRRTADIEDVPVKWESIKEEWDKVARDVEEGRVLRKEEREAWRMVRDILKDSEQKDVPLHCLWTTCDLVDAITHTLPHRQSPVWYPYANKFGYTDVYPYEVFMIVSNKTIEVREMKTTRDESVKLEWVSGGFLGHCVNQRKQKWFYESDREAPPVRIRRRKDGYWYDKYSGRFALSFEPYKFHDYNF
jgi:hypothetical protein